MLAKVTLLLCLAVVCWCDRPRYIGCQSTAECGKNYCCVIGMGRYSIPQCVLLRDAGESCRPYAEPVNTTLNYPDGASVDLSEVYYIHCPCFPGMSCEGGGDTPLCVDKVTNHVYDYSEENNFEY